MNRPLWLAYRMSPYLLVALLAAVTAAMLSAPPVASALSTGSIAGRVTDGLTSDPIEGVEVCAEELGEEEDFACAETNANGEYTLPGLGTGSYKVGFFVFDANYTNQYYDGKTTWNEADPVSVTAPATTSGIDAQMHEGGEIAGRVTDASTDDPLEGGEVCAIEASGEGQNGGCVETNANGEYTIPALPTRLYKVVFYPAYVCGAEGCASENYVPQYYDDKGAWAEADSVSVTAPATTSGIDAHMHEGGRISGRVTDALTNDPIDDVEACAFEVSGEFGTCAETNANGEYTIAGLATGFDKVGFFVDSGQYQSQYYGGDGSWFEASLVPVTVGSTTTGVDPKLIPIVQPKLTVSVVGTGSGVVKSVPSGIDCGSASCSHAFESGTPVTLTATPASGSTFTGWSGGCTGTGSCHVTLDGDTTVLATFSSSSSGGGGGSSGGGAAASGWTLTPTSPPGSIAPKKHRVCRRGFKKKTIKGKAKCVSRHPRKRHGKGHVRSRANLGSSDPYRAPANGLN